MKQNYTINTLIEMFEENTNKQPKARYSNNTIIAMLKNAQEIDTLTLETTRGKNNIVNRGSLAELLIINAIMLYVKGDNFKPITNTSTSYEPDLNTSHLDKEMLRDLEIPRSSNIEIKFSTSFSYATSQVNHARNVLVANNEGIYLVKGCDLNKDSHGKIKPEQPKGYRLNLLSDLLGY